VRNLFLGAICRWRKDLEKNPRQNLVDVTGIEPATSCLQSTRSPS
jgi:hypothetical protein